MIFSRTDLMPSSKKGRSRAGSNSSEFTHVSPDYTHVPPEYIHRAIPGHGDFPSASGSSFTVTKRDQGLVSPSQSTFSFADSEMPAHAISTPPSPAPSLYSTKPHVVQGVDEMMMANQQSNRDFPLEDFPVSRCRTPLERELVKKNSQYYNDVFAARDASLTPHEAVYRDSVITVEVKTNVIVRDEFLFLDEFAEHLSQRYQRPTSSILITLEHSACFLFAGSFESAYVVTITALSSLLQPAANKRNTALIQSHLSSSLGVLPDRGVIKFASFADDDLAISGTTYSGHVERLQRKQNEIGKKEVVRSPSINIKTAPERTSSIRSTQTRKSLRIDTAPAPAASSSMSMKMATTGTSTPQHPHRNHSRQIKSTPGSRIPSPGLHSAPLPSIPWDNNPHEFVLDRKAERAQRVGKRKSFFAFFGKF